MKNKTKKAVKKEKEVEKYHNLVKEMVLIRKNMAGCIKGLLIKGYTFGEIAKMLNKNSRQTVFSFYRTYLK